MSGFELRLLFFLNHWVGRSAALDSILRILAVWGPLWAAWEVARPWLAAEDPKRGLRILRDAALSGAIAFLGSQFLTRIRLRARPFLSVPVVLLYLVPNNASFPDPVIALGVAVTLGAVHRQRDRWLPSGIMTMLWVTARMMSGTMNPFDGLAGVAVGIVPVAVEELLVRIPVPKWAARTGAVALAVLLYGMFQVVHHTKPKLPPQSPNQEQIALLQSNGPVGPVSDARLKGFMPDEEAKLLATTDALSPPSPVDRIEVGRNRWIEVAGVKLDAGDHWDARSRMLAEWNAARTLQAIFAHHPELAEVDLWAVVPFRGHGGKEALRPVLFVQARRRKGAKLMHATPEALLLDSRKLLSTFGAEFALDHDFPVPGRTLPNGVAEGAG